MIEYSKAIKILEKNIEYQKKLKKFIFWILMDILLLRIYIHLFLFPLFQNQLWMAMLFVVKI